MSTHEGGTSPTEVDSGYRYERARNESPSDAVVSAATAVSGESAVPDFEADDATALPPLYDAVDPDALDRFLAPEDGREPKCSVAFTYGEYEVTASSNGVTIMPSR